MTNNLILVGRVVKLPELKNTETGTKVTTLTLAIPRPFKNVDGEYDTDFIDCTLWNSIAKSACDYCKKGDVVAIKGRIQTTIYEKDELKMNVLQVMVERISFISSQKKEKEEKTDNIQ